MALMVAAMFVVPWMDAIAKHLAQSLAPAQVTWGRFLFQTLLLLPLMLVGGRPVWDGRLGLHAARGVMMALAILCLVWGLKYLPLANAIAIFFVEPLILTLFGLLFLGESVGWRRLLAVAVGLGGALVVIRPNWALFGWAAVLPLGTAVFFAGYLALTRHMAVTGDAVVLQFWAGLFGALVLTATQLAGAAGVESLAPAWPSPVQWLLMVAMGALSILGHMLIAHAFRRASAGILAPFQYMEIISATALGLLLFGDFPDAMTLAGTAVIIGSGLYVFHRERKVAHRPVAVPDEAV